MGSVFTRPRRFEFRRLFQYSLRTFLLLTVGLAVLLGMEVRQARQRALAIAEFERRGDVSHYRREERSGWRGWRDKLWVAAAGENATHELRSVELSGSVTDDTTLVRLRLFPEIKSITLSCTRISDAGMAVFQNLRALEELTISTADITDAGLVHLARLPALESLDLHDINVDGRGLAYLVSCPALSQLCLRQTELTDEHLAAFREAAVWRSKSDMLIVFSIDGANLTGRRLLDPDSEKVVFENLSLDRATDESLMALPAELPCTSLAVGGPELTDAGLTSLRRLSELHEVRLRNAPQVTLSGVLALRRGLDAPRICIEDRPYYAAWASRLIGQGRILRALLPPYVLGAEGYAQFPEGLATVDSAWEPLTYKQTRKTDARERLRLYVDCVFQFFATESPTFVALESNDAEDALVGQQWNLNTGELDFLQLPMAHKLSLSPDGRMLATWSESDSATIRLFRDGRLIDTLAVRDVKVGSLHFPPWFRFMDHGRLLAATTWENEQGEGDRQSMVLWNTSTGTCLWTRELALDRWWDIFFEGERPYFVCLGGNRELTVLDLLSNSVQDVGRVQIPSANIDVSARGRMLMASNSFIQTEFECFDLRSKTCRRFRSESSATFALSDVGLLAFRPSNGEIEIHDIGNGAKLAEIAEAPSMRCAFLQFANNGRLLVGLGAGLVIVWDTSDLVEKVGAK